MIFNCDCCFIGSSRCYRSTVSWITPLYSPIWSVSIEFGLRHFRRVIFLNLYVHFFTICFCPSMLRLRLRVSWIFEKPVKNASSVLSWFTTLFSASLPCVEWLVILDLFFLISHVWLHENILSLSHNSKSIMHQIFFDSADAFHPYDLSKFQKFSKQFLSPNKRDTRSTAQS